MSTTTPASTPASAKRPRTESAGHRERSWVKPSTSIVTTPVHVGSFFFKTKDSSLGPEEEVLLKELAVAYAGYARRNIAQPGGERGLKGEVVGYADPRRSSEPDNRKLSTERASYVVRRLVRMLAVESGLIEGNFDIAAKTGGVAPLADEDGPELEANSLAPYRRADIYLEGGFIAPPASPLPPPTEPEPKPEPPAMKRPEHDWDRFDVHINRVDKEELRVMAIRMMTGLGKFRSARGGSHGSSGGQGGGGVGGSDGVDDYWWAISTRIELFHRDRRSKFPLELKPVKPSWWDGLSPPRPTGRGQLARRNPLQEKAELLKIWYLETIAYGDTYVKGSSGALSKALKEVHKDDPNPAVVWAAAGYAEQYIYMVSATMDLADEVIKLAK